MSTCCAINAKGFGGHSKECKNYNSIGTVSACKPDAPFKASALALKRKARAKKESKAGAHKPWRKA